MITQREYAELYAYESRHGLYGGNSGKRFMITGTDNFSYEDYMVALCDTQDEVDLILLERAEDAKKSGIPDSTYVRPPGSPWR